MVTYQLPITAENTVVILPRRALKLFYVLFRWATRTNHGPREPLKEKNRPCHVEIDRNFETTYKHTSPDHKKIRSCTHYSHFPCCNMLRFKWERDDAISLVTVKMGLAIPISHGNLRITNYRGNYTEMSSDFMFPSGGLLEQTMDHVHN